MGTGEPSAALADRRDGLAYFALLSGASIFVCAGLMLVMVASCFVLGRSISRSVPLFALAMTAGLVWWLAGLRPHTSRCSARAALLLVLAVEIFLSVWMASSFYDISHDGQVYHQETIILLKEGWNPFQSPNVIRFANVDDLWVNHYARGSEIISACIYRLTRNIELGKAQHPLATLGAFWLSLAMLLQFRKLQPAGCVAVAALLALNPISIYQSCSYYIDGQLAAAMTAMLVVGVIILLREKHLAASSPAAGCVEPNWISERWAGRMLLSLWTVLIVVAVSLKFTGLVFAGVFAAAALCCLVLMNFGRRMLRPSACLAGVTAAAMAFAAGFVNYNPYVTNTKLRGHPFYPLAGRHAIDFIPRNMPENFQTLSRTDRLVQSVFSKTADAYVASTVKRSELKVPFTVYRTEWEDTYTWADLRIGGWGPLFGGAIFLSAALLVLLVVVAPRHGLITAGGTALLLATVWIHPQCWWARYAPHLWLLPILLAISGLLARSREIRVFASLIVLALFANDIIVGRSYFHHQGCENRLVRAGLHRMARLDKPILVHFGRMKSARVRLQEAGIRFRETSDRESVVRQGADYLRCCTLEWCEDNTPPGP